MNKKIENKKPKSKARKIIEWIITAFFIGVFLVGAAATIDGMVQKNNNYGETLRFGWGNFIVRTDSMEPLYMKGTAIITHKDNVEDVYSYYIKNEKQIKAKSEEVYIDIIFKDIANGNYLTPSDSTLYDNTTGASGGWSMTHRLREIIYRPEVPMGDGRYVFIVAGINTGGHMAQAGQYQEFTEKQYLGVVKIHSDFLGGFFSFITSIWGLLILLLIPAIYLVISSFIDIFKALKDSEEEPVKAASTAIPNTDNGPNRISSLSDQDRERLKRELLEQMIQERKNASSTSKVEQKEDDK